MAGNVKGDRRYEANHEAIEDGRSKTQTETKK